MRPVNVDPWYDFNAGRGRSSGSSNGSAGSVYSPTQYASTARSTGWAAKSRAYSLKRSGTARFASEPWHLAV